LVAAVKMKGARHGEARPVGERETRAPILAWPCASVRCFVDRGYNRAKNVTPRLLENGVATR